MWSVFFRVHSFQQEGRGWGKGGGGGGVERVKSKKKRRLNHDLKRRKRKTILVWKEEKWNHEVKLLPLSARCQLQCPRLQFRYALCPRLWEHEHCEVVDLSYAVKVCRARGQDGRGQQGGAQLWRDQARGLQGVKHPSIRGWESWCQRIELGRLH